MRRGAAVALLALALAAAAAAAEAPPVPARALLERLRAAGRAEATVRLRRTDPLSGRVVERGGRLALELPGRARLDFDDGEVLTLRPDGGDWLQPALRQVVHAGPRGAAAALRWWGALLDPAGAGLEARRTGERTFALRLRDGDAAVPRLELDGGGLPRRMVLATPDGGSVEYRLARWRFAAARGPRAFRLSAPAGFEAVTLP